VYQLPLWQSTPRFGECPIREELIGSVPDAFPFHLLWSQPLLSGPRGLVLAREKGWLAAWDNQRWLYLVNVAGQRQGQVNLAESLTVAAVADDGSALAAGSKLGTIWWLEHDLSIRWQRKMTEPVLSLALDPFGQLLAVADAKDQVVIYDPQGEVSCRWQCPRALHHLAFVPAKPLLVGSADFGLVAGYDLAGQCLWRDGLVSHVGGLATSGDGAVIALACFTDGIQRYRLDGANLGKLKVHTPCRLLAGAFDCRRLVAGGLQQELVLLDAAGQVLGNHTLERPAAGLAMAPLGDEAYVALDDGRIQAFQL
jgi:hypothetical protein